MAKGSAAAKRKCEESQDSVKSEGVKLRMEGRGGLQKSHVYKATLSSPHPKSFSWGEHPVAATTQRAKLFNLITQHFGFLEGVRASLEECCSAMSGNDIKIVMRQLEAESVEVQTGISKALFAMLDKKQLGAEGAPQEGVKLAAAGRAVFRPDDEEQSAQSQAAKAEADDASEVLPQEFQDLSIRVEVEGGYTEGYSSAYSLRS
jgi:hypothetical protein